MISSRYISTLVVICLGGLLAGCQREQPVERLLVFPVQGTIRHQRRPAAGAIVTFRPRVALPNGRTPIGQADAQGNFQLSFYGEHDGAPAGTYDLFVYWPTHDGGPAPDRLAGRYSHPDRPIRAFTVVAGQNELPPLELP